MLASSALLAQVTGDLLVQGGEARARINDEQRHIRTLERCFGLHPHPTGETGLVLVLPPGSIDDREIEAQQVRFAQPAVARYPGLIIDQGQPFADQPVEQGRFADIRTTDDDNLGKRHVRHLTFVANICNPRVKS